MLKYINKYIYIHIYLHIYGQLTLHGEATAELVLRQQLGLDLLEHRVVLAGLEHTEGAFSERFKDQPDIYMYTYICICL